MPHEFDCPNCRRRIAANTATENHVQCPFCRSVIMVPNAGIETAGVPAINPVATAAPPARQGLAIAALVCGILGWVCPPVGAVGLALGIVAAVKINRRPSEYKGMGMAVGGICTGGTSLLITLILIAILLPSLSRARELSNRVVCSANMRQFGTGMYLYAQSDYYGWFPPNLETLLSEGHVTENQFACPSSNAVVRELDGSYEYIASQTGSSNPNNVVMYEKEGCHNGEGSNVLFQDGRVQFISPYSRVEQLVQETRDRLEEAQKQ